MVSLLCHTSSYEEIAPHLSTHFSNHFFSVFCTIFMATNPHTLLRREENHEVPVPAQMASEAMLGQHGLSGDTPRQLYCLIEGESPIFSVEVPGNVSMDYVKELVHKYGIGTKRAILPKDLVLLKVSRTLEFSKNVAAHFLLFIRST
jgi:hypothetical protein